MNRSPRNRSRALTVLELTVSLSIILIGGTLLIPVFAQKKTSIRSNCLSNVKQIALAMLMYNSDWDAAPVANHWMDSCYQYAKNEAIYHCPFANGGYGYAMRTKLEGVNLEKLKNAATEPMCFDSALVGRSAHTNSLSIPAFTRHITQNVGYVDGHVRGLKPSGTNN